MANPKVKIVYISHPITGDEEANKLKIQAIVRQLNMTRPDIVPFAPYYLDRLVLDDAVPAERERALENIAQFFLRKVVDEIWLFGDKTSPESAKLLAENLNIPVVDKTDKEYLP